MLTPSMEVLFPDFLTWPKVHLVILLKQNGGKVVNAVR